jgi:uncharacterized protein YbaR (Trm112 family)
LWSRVSFRNGYGDGNGHRKGVDLLQEEYTMSVDPKLLEILVCPVDKSPLEVVELPEAVRRRLVEKYRDQFKGEEPVVEIGLASPAGRVYPVVSGIPVMLVDDALSREEIED